MFEELRYAICFRGFSVFHFKLGVIPRSLLRQFEIRDFRLEAERNTLSACCGDFKNFVLDSAQELQIPDIAKA